MRFVESSWTPSLMHLRTARRTFGSCLSPLQSQQTFPSTFDESHLDDTQDLVLRECLTGGVQWQVHRVANTLGRVQPLWQKLIAVIHNEEAANMQLDVVAHLLGLEEIKWGTARHEEPGTSSSWPSALICFTER